MFSGNLVWARCAILRLRHRDYDTKPTGYGRILRRTRGRGARIGQQITWICNWEVAFSGDALFAPNSSFTWPGHIMLENGTGLAALLEPTAWSMRAPVG